MKTAEAPRMPVRGAELWPLSVEAYHALGEAGLIPEKTELLYGFVFNKMPKSPIHRAIGQRLTHRLEATVGPDRLVWREQPITCRDSEPEPDVSVICGK